MRRMWMAVVVALVQPAFAEPAYWPLDHVPAREPSAALAGFHSWRDACDEPAIPEAQRGYVDAWCTFAAGDHRAAIRKLTRLAAPALRTAIDVDVAVMVADTFTGAEAARWYLDRYAPMTEIDLAIAAFASFGKRSDARALITATEARIPREAKNEACKRIVRNAAIATSSPAELARTVAERGCTLPAALVPSDLPATLDYWWDLVDIADETSETTAVLMLETARDKLACNEQARVMIARATTHLMTARGHLANLDAREANLAATPACRPMMQLFPTTLDRDLHQASP